MNELLKSLSELIQSLNGGAKAFGDSLQRIYPEAWRVAVYQVQLNGFRYMAAWCFIAAVIFVIGLKFRQVEKSYRAEQGLDVDKSTDFNIAKWIAMSLAAVIAFTAICVNIDTITNPQYDAAIKVLSAVQHVVVDGR